MKPTLTQQQATQRVDDYMRQALGALPPAQLEDRENEPMACDDPTDDGPKGRVTVSRGYRLYGLPKEQNAANFQKTRQWGLAHDFGVLDDRDQPDRSLKMENRNDGFYLSLVESGDESKLMTLIVGSPCVWPNGTPAPEPQGQAAPNAVNDSTTPAAAASTTDSGPEYGSVEYFAQRFRSR